MSILKRLFGGTNATTEVNVVTRRERYRFAKSMTGESAVHAAVRLGCIAG